MRCSRSATCFAVFAQPWKSGTDPESVAVTSSTSPGAIASISFFAFTIGIGHFAPRTSSFLTAISGLSSTLRREAALP